MAQTVHAAETAAPDRTARVRRAEVTGWVGFVAFGGFMMMLAGAMQAINGLVAIFNDEWVVFGNRANLLVDITAWGWIHLGIGAVLVLAGIGVLLGNTLARWVGVAAACLSILANFAFLPAYPVWSMVIIAADALVIYALIAHGREIRLP